MQTPWAFTTFICIYCFGRDNITRYKLMGSFLKFAKNSDIWDFIDISTIITVLCTTIGMFFSREVVLNPVAIPITSLLIKLKFLSVLKSINKELSIFISSQTYVS